MDMTVVIPTYNGAERIPAVLNHLRSQITSTSTQWEILVVDNNSQDRTAEIVRQHQQDWPQTVPLRYVLEPRQGLAFARQCGIENAAGPLVGFLDDDNWPSENWVAEAIKFGQENPGVGAYGGKTEGFFDQEPDISIKAISKFLALQDYGPHPYEFQPQKQILPAGAGLVVRRAAWLTCIPKTLVRTARGGNDYEISLRLAKHGWRIFYNPSMRIKHYIPSKRLEREYLLKLIHHYGLCTCELMMIDVPVWKQPLLLVKFFLGTLKRLAFYLYKHGYNPSDVSLQCRLKFHMGNLKSPIAYVAQRTPKLHRV